MPKTTTSKIAWSDDLLNREEKAKFLTSFIDKTDNVKVININSPWGTGKSYFLTNWRADLFSQNRATVYFNAWENDFTGDPLISLIANIRDQLETYLPSDEQARKKLANFTNSAKSAIVAISPAIIKGLTKKFTGIELDKLADVLEQTQAVKEEKTEDDTTSEIAGDSAEKFVEHLINSNKDSLQSVANFKSSLKNLITSARSTDRVDPVYIFIDELDRCRPTYAIELLERVKHFFDIEECKFIIATDTAQLSHSIKAVYGQDFSSIEYLKRFFDLTYSFGKQSLDEWISHNIKAEKFQGIISLNYIKTRPHDIRNTSKSQPPASNCIFRPELTEPQLLFKILAETFNTDLRQLHKIKFILESILAQAKNNIYFFIAAYLVFLKNHEEEIFEELFHSEPENTFHKIKNLYPSPHSLYFRNCSLDPHKIACLFISLTRMDRQQLLGTRDSEQTPVFAQNAATDMAIGEESLKKYQYVVKLAASIE